MLLQRLCDYADQRLSLPPSNYQEQPIRYVIDLDRDGRFLSIIDTADPTVPAQRRGKRRLAPALVRTSGVRAKLLADKASYALGYVPPGAGATRAPQEHEAFLALLRACAAATDAQGVKVVLQFLQDAGPADITLPEDFDGAATVTFRVETEFPMD